MSILNLIIQDFTRPEQLVIIFKIVISTFLGMVIGWNRRSSNAGMRTFSLITLGATIFTIISIIGFPTNTPTADQARIVAQIVTGVGFLGAGVIWKTKLELTGLTTAASIWTSAAIGVAVGLGLFALALSGTLLIIITLMLKPILIKYEGP
ncbi:MAG TPA: MgtC/SapB family protein [Candidatus Nanoarchaeia archaeon]|nr:MgtC/SapB family protein [Candidatus Nanoarchaeia archaeon]